MEIITCCVVFVLSSTQYMFALPLHSCRLWILLMMVFEVRISHQWQLVIIYLGEATDTESIC